MKIKPIHLIARYYGKPKNPKMTRVAGYMKDPANIAWDEAVILTLGLKNKDLHESKIVLNISAQRVIKDSFNTNKTFDELFEYFYNSDPDQIRSALGRLGLTMGTTKDESVIEENVQREEEASSGSIGTAETEPTVAS